MLEIYSGTVTIVIFGESAAQQERAAESLVSANVLAGNVSAGDPLPPPVAGAMEGRLRLLGARRWMTLVGLVMLVAVVGVAFVDYEMVRADAEVAGANAENARVSCVTSPLPASIAERKRRVAQCERLPAPSREAERVQRRWDRRGPWYGFAAVAILLPTAVMFVQSRRRRATSPTRDPAPSRPWRIATIAVRLAIGIMIWAVLVYLVVDRWEQLVEATGGSTHDCHYPENDCGVLGEFTEAHPRIMLWLIRAGAAIPAAAVIWLLSRLFRSLGDQGDRTRHLRFRKPDSQSVLASGREFLSAG